jgi:hypothetical protein
MADLDQLTKDIQAGDYDGRLGDLFEVLFARARDTEVEFGWRIKLSDTDQWDAESVTLQELAFAEKACSTASRKVSYLELDPMKQMDHLIALIVAHLVHIGGLRVSEATSEAQKLTVADLGDIVSVYEIKAPKVDAGATSNGS